MIPNGISHIRSWEAEWPPVPADDTLGVPDALAEATLAELGERLRENYPFFHPSYAGQMLKPPHPIALAAYAMAQRINPNNHALDGGPATAGLEREVVAQLAAMFGYDPAAGLGHLTSSGTIANLEALWIARELAPRRGIAYSAQAHYTHGRMCGVLGIPGIPIATDAEGRMDLDDLRATAREGRIGTVVATLGTTSLGAVDPLPEILALGRELGFRVHVDGAYGGFFRLLAGEGETALRPADAAAYRATAEADSIVVDPHKHGLQPYGCGCVLFREAAVGRFYAHESPATYFSSEALHLGEISLECSRAGASAAALWATLRCLPLEPHAGLGAVLRRTRAAAVAWADLIAAGPRVRLLQDPALDILAFFPLPAGDRRASAISAATRRTFHTGMSERNLYLATLAVAPGPSPSLADVIWDEPALTCLRSVLMKPEHLAFVPELHARLLQAMNAPGT